MENAGKELRKEILFIILLALPLTFLSADLYAGAKINEPQVLIAAGAYKPSVDLDGDPLMGFYLKNKKWNPIRAIAEDAEREIRNAVYKSMEKVVAQYGADASKIPIPSKITQRYDDVTVTFRFKRLRQGFICGTLSASMASSIYATFRVGHQTASVDNDGKDEVSCNYTACLSAPFELDSKTAVLNISGGKNNCNFSGQARDITFVLSLDSKKQLGFSQELYDNFDVDPQSYHKISTSGSLPGIVSGSWVKNGYGIGIDEEWEINIDRFELLPVVLGRGLTTKIEMLLIAESKSKDKKVSNEVLHEEVYTGTMFYEKDTGMFKWNDDLLVVKTDNRTFQEKAIFSQAASSEYFESVRSQGDVHPIKGDSEAATKTIRKLYFSQKPPASGPDMPGCQHMEGTIEVELQEARMKGLSYDTFIRDGTGSVNTTNLELKGIYDKQDALMLVTDPDSMAGQKVEPFSYCPAQFIPDVGFRLSFGYVPGMFDAANNFAEVEKIVIATRPVEAVPSVIHVWYSYLDGDPAFTDAQETAVEEFLSDIESKFDGRMVIKRHQTNNLSDMAGALDSLDDGSWLINLGHATSGGLKAGNDFLPYDEIYRVLKRKQVKLSVAAGDSCFFAYIPIGERVLGSLSYGISGDYLQVGDYGALNFNTLLGVGECMFSYTTDDLLKQIGELLKS